MIEGIFDKNDNFEGGIYMTRFFNNVDDAARFMENSWYPTELIRVENGWLVIVER